MTPYRVVVCEDDAQLGEDLARRCREIFAGWRVEAEVWLFASADALGKEQTCSSFKNVGTAGAVVTSCACGKHHRRRCAGESIKDVARYAIFTSPSFHSTSNPRASQRARTGA